MFFIPTTYMRRWDGYTNFVLFSQSLFFIFTVWLFFLAVETLYLLY